MQQHEIDQWQAAIRDASRLVDLSIEHGSATYPGECYTLEPEPPAFLAWFTEFRRSARQALTDGSLRICPHLRRTPAQPAVCWAHEPDALKCVPCSIHYAPSRRCANCGRRLRRVNTWPGELHHSQGPFIVLAKICNDCSDAYDAWHAAVSA